LHVKRRACEGCKKNEQPVGKVGAMWNGPGEPGRKQEKVSSGELGSLRQFEANLSYERVRAAH